MNDVVQSVDELEVLYPGIAKISPATWGKEVATINDAYRKIIEACPFAAVASLGPKGLDCSPRGDGPGFIHIIDEKTIALPDRRGNNRLDTLRNILHSGKIALLMMIPGVTETFRINGTAVISTNAELLKKMETQGKVPTSAIVITVETMFFQCARALVRSRLWDQGSKIDPKSLPSAGDLVKSAMAEFDGQSYDATLQERQAKTLY